MAEANCYHRRWLPKCIISEQFTFHRNQIQLKLKLSVDEDNRQKGLHTERREQRRKIYGQITKFSPREKKIRHRSITVCICAAAKGIVHATSAHTHTHIKGNFNQSIWRIEYFWNEARYNFWHRWTKQTLSSSCDGANRVNEWEKGEALPSPAGFTSNGNHYMQHEIEKMKSTTPKTICKSCR